MTPKQISIVDSTRSKVQNLAMAPLSGGGRKISKLGMKMMTSIDAGDKK